MHISTALSKELGRKYVRTNYSTVDFPYHTTCDGAVRLGKIAALYNYMDSLKESFDKLCRSREYDDALGVLIDLVHGDPFDLAHHYNYTTILLKLERYDDIIDHIDSLPHTLLAQHPMMLRLMSVRAKALDGLGFRERGDKLREIITALQNTIE